MCDVRNLNQNTSCYTVNKENPLQTRRVPICGEEQFHNLRKLNSDIYLTIEFCNYIVIIVVNYIY